MSLFTTAKVLAPKKATKTDKKDVINLPGLKDVAMIDALMKTLESVKKTLSKEIKNEAFDMGYSVVCETGKRFDSFRGVDGVASASIEMRKKAGNVELAEEEVKALRDVGIEPHLAVTVPATFGIDPKYAQDTKLLEKISKLLEGNVPEDLFFRQEEVSKLVVSDEVFDKACALKNKLPRSVLESLTVMAIKPKLESTDITTIFQEVQALVLPPVDAE